MTIALPGSFPVAPLAPVYIDGIPAALVSPPAAPRAAGQDFWSSQPRFAGDPAAEELIISLGQSRLMNYISLDLPHFPHVARLWWWDGSAWQPLLTASGVQLTIITSGSVPAVVDNPAAIAAGLNPYHYGAGHWVRHNEAIRPVTTTRLLLHVQRPAPRSGTRIPHGPNGQPVPYPLGARNIDFGLRISSPADVPVMPRSPVSVTMRQPFTTSVDVNGSPVQVAARENRAADLLQGATWRSAPQPSSASVVTLYVDSRDAAGQPQLIDAFHLEPVTSGPRFNLYWSAGPPPETDFAAIDDPIAQGILVPDGTEPPRVTAQGIRFGALPGWLDLSNQASGASTTAPWWAGLEIMPSFSSADSGSWTVADAGIFAVTFSAGAWTVTAPDGGVLGRWQFSFAQGDRLRFVIGFNGAVIFAWSSAGGALFQASSAATAQAAVIRFGGAQGSSQGAGNCILSAFILKQEAASLTAGIPASFTAFAAGPASYVSGSAASVNAVARFTPAFVISRFCPWGFVGGLGAAYEACSWTMVPRSYVLARGYAEFSPVKASAWKFEFTNLQPEPYDYAAPPAPSARYFPPQFQPGASIVSPTTPAVLDAGLSVNQATAPGIFFNDVPPAAAASPAPGRILPTEALYAPDPSAAAQMAQAGGGLYAFQPWQPPHVIPASPAGPSAYQETSAVVTGRVAYFVALSSIAMYRSDYTAAEDTAQYTDNFADGVNIDPSTITPGGWGFVPGTGLITPANLDPGGVAAESVILPSAHPVTGLQFATVQSPPVQLLEDADFSDPGFANWAPVGDALPLSVSDAFPQLGIMAQVTRGSAPILSVRQPSSWAWLQSAYASWAVLEAAVPRWFDFGQPPVTAALGGLGYTGSPVALPPGGRASVAARVFSPVALTAPLYLQLLNGATGAVIAEAEQAVAGGSVTEWFAGFTIGQGTVSGNAWAQVESSYASWAAANGKTWDDIDTSVTPFGATVTARLVQKVSTGDVWDVDNISVFAEALAWQFSVDGGATWSNAYDVRNNPRGAVVFPAKGTQLKWRVTGYQPGLAVSSLSIRPWYVTWPRGVPARPAGIGHGPNIGPQDHYAPVENDPLWQASSSPVPDDWFFSVRQAIGVAQPADDFPGPAIAPPNAGLRSGFAWTPPAPAALDQTWTDIYADTYTGTYALADGGDIYTDTWCDVYGVNNPATTGTVRPGAAAFSAAATAAFSAGIIPLADYGVGADLGPVPASDTSVSAWIAGTGEPIPARRIALGNQIPASLAASDAAQDAGIRRVLFDIRPDGTTTPAQLDAFLASCAAGGLAASVSIWAGADAVFADPQDWLDLLSAYVPVIRRYGYPHVLAVSNDAFSSGWVSSWYPQGLVDVIAPEFWCQGPAPGSGAPTLAVAQMFADARGLPFGLSGFGADHALFTAAQGSAFCAYVTALFTARTAAAKQCYDLLWLGTGTYSVITGPPALLTAWRAMAQALD